MLHRFLLAGLVSIAFAAMPADGPKLNELLARAVKVRHANLARIHSLSCSFQRATSASADIIAARSDAKKETYEPKVSPEEARKGLIQSFDCHYDETSRGLFRFQSTRPGNDGKTVEKTFVSFDGKESWKLRSHTLEGGTEIGNAEVGADRGKEYAGLANVRGLIGSVLPAPHEPSLVDRIIQGKGTVAIGVEPVDGDPCLAARREETVNGAPTRYTVWLDPSRQFVLRRAKVEVFYPVNQHWFAFNQWTVQKLGQAEIPGDGGAKETFWYPSEATLQTFNYRDEETFGEKITIAKLELNKPPPVSSFTPKIPQGSNVRDARTGTVSVHGNGPSPGLKRLVAERTRQTREKLREVEALGDPGAQEEPASWINYGSWITFVCGAAALVVALVLKRRG